MTDAADLGKLQEKLDATGKKYVSQISQMRVKRRALFYAVREKLKQVALGRPERIANSDDAALILQSWGFDVPDLGPSMGTLFRSGWKWTGELVPSRRPSSRGRMIKIFRLREYSAS